MGNVHLSGETFKAIRYWREGLLTLPGILPTLISRVRAITYIDFPTPPAQGDAEHVKIRRKILFRSCDGVLVCTWLKNDRTNGSRLQDFGKIGRGRNGGCLPRRRSQAEAGGCAEVSPRPVGQFGGGESPVPGGSPGCIGAEPSQCLHDPRHTGA